MALDHPGGHIVISQGVTEVDIAAEGPAPTGLRDNRLTVFPKR